MATRRIKEITNTATTFASDDFIALDGTSQGTRKMDKDDLIAEVSAGVSGDYLEEANNLSDVASLDTSKLNMEIPDVGTAPNEVPLSGQLGTMAFQDSSGVSVGQLEVTDKVDGTLNVESTDGLVASFERTGNAKLKVHSDANGPYLDTETGHNFRIFTNGGEAVRVDGSGQVGIGTSSPGSYNGDANDLVVGAAGTGNRGLTIASGSTNYGVIYFADGTTGNQQYRGAISYNHNSDSLSLSTSGTTRWSIGSGGVLLGAAGNGIRFDTGTTLDSYEEGTWTPALSTGTGESITYAGQVGDYTKIGNIVYCSGKIQISSAATYGSANHLQIGGLPFTAENSSRGISFSYGGGYGNNSLFQVGDITGAQPQSNGASSFYLQRGQYGGTSDVYYRVALLNTTGYLLFSLTYETAQ